MDLAQAVAQRINYLCEKQGISINKLATLSGLTQSTVDSILKGKSRNPSIITLKKVANGLGMSLSEFLDDPLIEGSEED